MEAINQFGWAEVAGIAGITIVCLLTLLGALLGIILKRQNGSNNGLLNQVKQIQSSIENKIDAEITDRKEDFAQLRDSIELSRKEERTDIGELHRKLEAVFSKVMSEFKSMCDQRQALFSEVQKSELKRAEDKLILACGKIEKLEKFNVRFMQEAKDANI